MNPEELYKAYDSLKPVEKCMFLGELTRRTWYARVFDDDYSDDKYNTPELKRLGLITAREQQIPDWVRNPDTQNNTHTFCGGRSGGKTASATKYSIIELLTRPGLRMGILGPGYSISVGVGINGTSGIKTFIEKWDKSLIKTFDKVNSVLTLVNGSMVYCYSSDSPKKIEGPEFHLAWVDEIAELSDPHYVYKVRFEPTVRLIGDNGEPIRKLITGTPEPTDLMKDIRKQYENNDGVAWTQISTADNKDNVDKEMLKLMRQAELSDPYRYRAKFLGELLMESSGALLTWRDIQMIRVKRDDPRFIADWNEFDRMALCVDSAHDGKTSKDEWGLIIQGKKNNTVYVVGDASEVMSTNTALDRIVSILKLYPQIREIIVEDDKSVVVTLLDNTIKDKLTEIGRRIKITPVSHRNKSKLQRADPVSVHYQLQEVLHQEDDTKKYYSLDGLEQEWTQWNPHSKNAKSPNRIDAAVYGVVELIGRKKVASSIHFDY